jgi:hypothetical protein
MESSVASRHGITSLKPRRLAWDVQVTNQIDALVASYDILTLVAKRS